MSTVFCPTENYTQYKDIRYREILNYHFLIIFWGGQRLLRGQIKVKLGSNILFEKIPDSSPGLDPSRKLMTKPDLDPERANSDLKQF